MCPRVETPRLVLQAHTQDDFSELAAMWADPDVVRHISGKPSTPRDSWSRLLRYRGLWPVLGYGYWCVREKRTGRYVGDVGFADFGRGAEPSISGVPEAGWVLAAWAHGRGFASESVAAALAWLDQGVHQRSVCLIAPENVASIRIAGRTGFARSGVVRLEGEVIPLWVRERAPSDQHVVRSEPAIDGVSPTMSETGYLTTSVFVVQTDAVERFVAINTRAASIYKKHGALASTVLRLADGATRYGCAGLTERLGLRTGERAFCVQDEYRDQPHSREVLRAVDVDSEIESLFRELETLVDFRRAHRAEWGCSVGP